MTAALKSSILIILSFYWGELILLTLSIHLSAASFIKLAISTAT